MAVQTMPALEQSDANRRANWKVAMKQQPTPMTASSQGHRADDVQTSDGEGLQPDGFETEYHALVEDRQRAKRMCKAATPTGPTNWLNLNARCWVISQRPRHLKAANIDKAAARALSARLTTGVTTGRPLLSLASSMSMRSLRARLIDTAMTAFESYEDGDLATFTVLNVKWVYDCSNFDSASAARIAKQFRTHLIRLGVFDVPGPFIAFLHGEFEPASGTYTLHFHGLTTIAKAEALKRLSGMQGYYRTATGAQPIRCEKVRNRRKQVSYLLKAYWPMKALRFVGGVRKRDRRHHRIPEPYATQALLWLDRHRLRDLTVMNECWSPRNGGTQAMRALYLLIQQH